MNPSKRQTWPPNPPTSPSEADYETNAHEKLEFNERLAHYRSRIEHVFSRACVGRWLAFKNWTWNSNLLFYAFSCALIIHNVEMFGESQALFHKKKIVDVLI